MPPVVGIVPTADRRRKKRVPSAAIRKALTTNDLNGACVQRVRSAETGVRPQVEWHERDEAIRHHVLYTFRRYLNQMMFKPPTAVRPASGPASRPALGSANYRGRNKWMQEVGRTRNERDVHHVTAGNVGLRQSRVSG